MKKKRKKPVVKSVYSNKDLKAAFVGLNKKFFNGIMCNDSTVVRFENEEGEIEGDDGVTMYAPPEIVIHQRLKKHPTLSLIVLIHEMAHLAMFVDGYIGYVDDGGHHIRFHAELNRLYKAGIYEGLL